MLVMNLRSRDNWNETAYEAAQNQYRRRLGSIHAFNIPWTVNWGILEASSLHLQAIWKGMYEKQFADGRQVQGKSTCLMLRTLPTIEHPNFPRRELQAAIKSSLQSINRRCKSTPTMKKRHFYERDGRHGRPEKTKKDMWCTENIPFDTTNTQLQLGFSFGVSAAYGTSSAAELETAG
jgi:hypothetical protein